MKARFGMIIFLSVSMAFLSYGAGFSLQEKPQTKKLSMAKSKSSYAHKKSSLEYDYPDPAIHCNVVLQEPDTVRTTYLHLGDTLCVMLAGVMGTGYQWEIVSSDTTVISRLGRKESLIPRNLPKGYTGYPERNIWHFKAQREGKTAILMVYRRSWEKDKPPLKTFKADITVGGL